MGIDSENRPQRGQFLPDLQAHSPAMGQKASEKWTAAALLQPMLPKSDRLLGLDKAFHRSPPQSSGPLLRHVFHAQHRDGLADDSINQNVIWVRHQFARSLHAPDAAHLWVVVKLRDLLHQQVTHFNGSAWVVLGDVGGNALAVGNGGGFP